MKKLFGTDGVRGIANLELTPELAFNLGKAATYVLSKKKKRPVVIIGEDTRVSGDMLRNALTAGILAVGGDVIKLGVIPTPGIAFLVKHYNADIGVVISASHNSFEYNGIKFFNKEGFKLDDKIEDEIGEIIEKNIDVNSHVVGEEIGRRLEAEENASEVYFKHLISSLDFDLSNKKIVLDCANGAAYEIAEKVYKALGANVITIGNSPNGVNINKGYGSTCPEKLQEKVVEEGAFVGMAFDGDADRLICVDENGKIIDGDKLICICAKMLKEEGRLKENTVTGTIMSNIGFHKYLESIGCVAETSNVGDRYVLEKMKENGSILGGEQSGHIIFLEHATTGDGVLASLQVIKAILKSGKPASKVAEDIYMYPQVLKNVKVKNENKHRYREDEEVIKVIKQVEDEIKGEGRVLIRPSGTEPIVRVMIEGKELDYIAGLADDIGEVISKKFG